MAGISVAEVAGDVGDNGIENSAHSKSIIKDSYIAASDQPAKQLTNVEVARTVDASASGSAKQDNMVAVRNELDELKQMNFQLMRRIQYLESKLPQTVQANGAQYASSRPVPGGSYNAAGRNAVTEEGDQSSGGSGASENQGAKSQSDLRKKEPDKSRGVDDLISEAHTLFDQTWTTEIAYEYTHFDRSQLALNGFLALDAIFLGNISIDEVESDIFKTSLVNRWGISPRLQLNLDIPYLYRKTKFISGGAEFGSVLRTEAEVSDNGIGDVTLGASYQLFRETLSRPDTVLNFSISAPTGTDPYGIDVQEVLISGDPNDPLNPPVENTNLKVPDTLPTGTGLWAATAGISLLKTSDPALFFANLSYTHYFEEDFDDLGVREGDPDQPGEVALGDQIQLGLGIAFAINERTSMSMWFTQRFFGEAEITQNGVTQEVVGSETSTGSFDIGVTHALSQNLSVVAGVGIGLTTDSSDYRFSLRFPYRF